MNNDPPSCRTCRYWQHTPHGDGVGREKDTGLCYRYPPTPLADRFTRQGHPRTSPTDWCGEWRDIRADSRDP